MFCIDLYHMYVIFEYFWSCFCFVSILGHIFFARVSRQLLS